MLVVLRRAKGCAGANKFFRGFRHISTAEEGVPIR